MVQARTALLDALEALGPHRDAVIVIGAQAVYLHTGEAQVALAEATKDSDLALDTRQLEDAPLVEELLIEAGFELDTEKPQPGRWRSAAGIPVDLMVPEALAGPGGPNARAARISPHGKMTARRADGLEAAVVDHMPMLIRSLEDDRALVAQVAGPAALLVAKLHKIGERRASPGRLVDKDAHDIYRLLTAVQTGSFVTVLQRLREHDLAGQSTTEALALLDELFASGMDALGSVMAGRAEQGIGDPETVAASAAALARDILDAVELEPRA